MNTLLRLIACILFIGGIFAAKHPHGPVSNRLNPGDIHVNPEGIQSIQAFGASEKFRDASLDLNFDSVESRNDQLVIMNTYFQENKTLSWLMESVGATRILAELTSMSPSRAIPSLTTREIKSILASLKSQSPSTSEMTRLQPIHEIEMTLITLTSFRKFIDDSIAYTPAILATVPGTIEIFYGKKNRQAVFDGLGALCAMFQFAAPLIQTLGAASGMGAVASETIARVVMYTAGFMRFVFKVVAQQMRLDARPVGEGRDRWLRWTAEQVSDVTEIMYGTFREIVANGTPHDIRELYTTLSTGALVADAASFARHFRSLLAQAILNQPDTDATPLPRKQWDQSILNPKRYLHLPPASTPFSIYHCTGSHCKHSGRHLPDGAVMKSSLSWTQVEYLHNIGIRWDDFYLGKNGWNVAYGGEYSCIHGIRMRYTNVARCSQKRWNRGWGDANDRDWSALLEEKEEEVPEDVVFAIQHRSRPQHA